MGNIKTKSTTIYDIARKAGVSKTTAAYVLSGKANNVGIAAKTVCHVKDVAGQLGYVPNLLARSLAGRRTRSVSVLLSDIAESWGHQVLSRVSSIFRDRNYTPFISVDWGDSSIFEKEIISIIERQDEGVICHTGMGDKKSYSLLQQKGIPIVFLGDIPEKVVDMPGINSVIWDDVPAVKKLVHYLIKKGRRRIAFVGYRHGVISDMRRFNAYQQALTDAGVDIEDEWIIWVKQRSLNPTEDPKLFLSNEELSFLSLKRMGGVPDAIVCLNDAIAEFVVLALEGMGIKVPDDVAVTGIGNLRSSMLLNLTTLHEPLDQLGTIAAEIMLELIENPGTEPIHRKIVCNELIVRKST